MNQLYTFSTKEALHQLIQLLLNTLSAVISSGDVVELIKRGPLIYCISIAAGIIHTAISFSMLLFNGY
jgi:hypothetical protein